MISIHTHEGTDVEPTTFTVSDGAPSTATISSTYTIRDYNNTSVDMITGSVSSSSESDIDTIGNMIVSAINTNSENPINFSAVRDGATFTITAETAGDVSGLWSITADHGGSDGNLSFNTATVDQIGLDIGTNAGIPTSGEITLTDFLGATNGDA